MPSEKGSAVISLQTCGDMVVKVELIFSVSHLGFDVVMGPDVTIMATTCAGLLISTPSEPTRGYCSAGDPERRLDGDTFDYSSRRHDWPCLVPVKALEPW